MIQHIVTKFLVLLSLLLVGNGFIYAADNETAALAGIPLPFVEHTITLSDGTTITGISVGSVFEGTNAAGQPLAGVVLANGTIGTLTNTVTNASIESTNGTTWTPTTTNPASLAFAAGMGASTVASTPVTPGSISGGPITVITSESIPGANCTCVTGADCTKVETRKYSCIVQPGLAGFQTILAQVIRYIINIVLLLGVLAVVGLGITWSFAGGDDVKMKSTLKTWAINIIVGLIILFLFKYILMFIAPWIYQ